MTLEIAFYVDEEEDHIELTQKDFDLCQDIPTLLRWYDALDTKFLDMSAQIEARRIAGTDDAEWIYSVSQALAYTNIGRGRIKRKLLLENAFPNRNSEITRLHENLAKSKSEAAFGRALRKVVLALPSGPDLINRAERLAIELDTKQREAGAKGNKI